MKSEADREDVIDSVDRRSVAAQQERVCVIIGPPNSGKATFRSIFERTFAVSDSGQNLQLDRTSKHQFYTVSLRKPETSLNRAIDAAKHAQSIVLCVDITDPHHELIERHLAVLLAELSCDVLIEQNYSWHERILHRLKGSVASRERHIIRALNADRFLLLLTKVDLACSFAETPALIASLIEPVTQARESLGVPLLWMIQASLRPGATFAVGISSALGFHPVTGKTVARHSNQIRPSDEIDQETFDYYPFGIREAVSFLTNGQVGGVIQVLNREDLLSGRYRRPIRLRLQT